MNGDQPPVFFLFLPCHPSVLQLAVGWPNHCAGATWNAWNTLSALVFILRAKRGGEREIGTLLLWKSIFLFDIFISVLLSLYFFVFFEYFKTLFTSITLKYCSPSDAFFSCSPTTGLSLLVVLFHTRTYSIGLVCSTLKVACRSACPLCVRVLSWLKDDSNLGLSS